MTRIAFAKWQPDLQGLTNDGQQDAKNAYPLGSGGFGPVKALSAISTTGLSAQALGAISATDTLGQTNTFAGDATKLYKLSAAVFSDVSKVGGYTVGGTERWEMAQYGQRILATEITDPVQYYDLGSSALFADLAGSPPNARHIAVVRDFVVLGNTINSPNEIFWSGFNNSEQWSVGTNQCDSQTLQGGGWIQGIVGGAVGYVIQEHAITRMTYVGPPVIFQFDIVETARGAASASSIITIGATTYFYAQDGFYSFDGANGSQPIGNGKVDNWFAAHLAGSTFTQITVGYDPINRLIYWSFVSTDAVDTSHPDTVLVYNLISKEWSYAKFDHEILYSSLSEGWTLEQVAAAYPIIENVPVSFDSRVWTGGAAYLAAFTTGHQLASFSGSNLAALLETADFEGVPGKRSLITNLRPLCDTSAATGIVRSRERFADSTTDLSTSIMQSNGDIPLMASGRYHRAQISIPAATVWTFATGVEVDAQDDGEL